MTSKLFQLPGFACAGIKHDDDNPGEYVMNVRFYDHFHPDFFQLRRLLTKLPNTIFLSNNSYIAQIRLTNDDSYKSLIWDLTKKELQWAYLETIFFHTCSSLVHLKKIYQSDKGQSYFQLILISTVVCGVFEKTLQDISFEDELLKLLHRFTLCKGRCKKVQPVSSLKFEIKDYCLVCSNYEIQRRFNQIVYAVCHCKLVLEH